MDLQEFAKALPAGTDPVKAVLKGYVKRGGGPCDYTVLIRPDVDSIYRDSIEILEGKHQLNPTISIAMHESALKSMLRGLQSKIGNDHVVMTTNGPSVLFTALVVDRTIESSSKTPKSELARAKHHLRSMCPVGKLKVFRLDRCKQVIVDGVNILT